MKNHKIKSRLLSLTLVLCMTAATPVTALAGSNEGLAPDAEAYTDAAFADGDGTEPNAIQDTYTVTTKDGVTTNFYKVDIDNFADPDSQMAFYDAMLNAPIIDPENPSFTKTNDISIRKAWLKVASAILLDKSYSGRNHKACNYMAGSADNWDENPRSERGQSIPFNSAASLKDMEQELMKYMPYNSGNEVLNRCGKFQNDAGAKSGPVFYQAGLGTEYGDDDYEYIHSINAVVFSDFKLSPILPDAGTAGNYITETSVGDVIKEDVLANTTLIHDANTEGSGSQSVEKTTAVSVSSEVSGSTSYSWSESLTVGVEYGFSDIVKATLEVGFSSSQSIEKGLSEGKAESNENKEIHTIETPLPPYTGAMLKKVSGSQQIVTKYNCPVALTYTVRMLHYDEKHRYCNESYLHLDTCLDASSSAVTFAPNAQKDLFNRYKEKNYNTDKDGVKWSNYGDNWSWAGVSGEICKKSLSYAEGFAPIASTTASFTQTINTTDFEIGNMAPLHPLNYVQLEDPDNDAEKKLEPGESFRVDTIKVEGKNEKDGDYYGFNQKYGKWVLTDEDGKEITDGSIATLTENKRNKVLTLNAVAPGTVYLDYLIDEDKYSTYYDSSTFATNASLSAHPVIEVTIAGHPVTGVTLDPSKLTLKEGGTGDLTAVVAPEDATDKTVTWTVADPKVATVADGRVTGVAAGKTKVTVKTTDGNKTANADITVKYATPTAAQTEETLTGLVAGAKYKINGTEYTADSAGTIKVDKAWHDKEVSIVRAGSDSDLDSDAQKLTIVEKPVAVTEVTVDPAKETVAEGETATFTATVAPEDATNKGVKWTTADANVATIAEDGTVTGVEAGKTKVTATTLDGEKTATADVTVMYATPAAEVSDEKLTKLVANGAYKINGTAYTADAAGTIPVDEAWNGTEITIVRVNTDADLNSDEQKLKVVEKIAVTGVTVDPAKVTVAEGKTASLTATVAPEDATIKDVTWDVADPGVATVQDGTVTGVAAGKTKVIVTTVDGEKTADADVTVKYATPAAKQTKENITGLVANAEYQINGTQYTADGEGTIAVDKKWYDKTISIVRVNTDTDLNSDEQKLKVKDPSGKDPAPSGLISLSKVKINGFKSSLPYTGEAVEQNVTLTYTSGKTRATLVKDKDYTVTYKNNYDLGTATAIFEAIDDDDALYTGSVEKTFKITGKYILNAEGKEENCIVTLASDEYPYANDQIKPEVTVTALLVNNEGETEERVLTQGKDFTVSYKNNKKVAGADAVNPKNGKDVAPQVVVKGKGNYVFADTADMKKGVVRRFAITQCDLEELVLTTSDVVYNKTAGKYKNTKIQFYNNDFKDLKLKAKKDYTTEFETSDNSESPAAGQTVTVTITAKTDGNGNYTGNYEGTVTATYRIVDKKENTDISKAKVIVNPNVKGKAQPCTYTGSAIEPGQEGQPELKVTVGSGKNLKTLNVDEDFEILGYYNNIQTGKNAVILIKGKDACYGYKVCKFQIK